MSKPRLSKIKIKSSHIFINCPFDESYRPILEAIVFTVYDLGVAPRCALEEDDSAESRLSKIERMIAECRFGIHDLSAVQLSGGLPRFNMPLELGLFLGCKRHGPPNQSQKRTLILDSQPYRYKQFISDLSGQDIHSHSGDRHRAIHEVRDWLRASSGKVAFPGGDDIIQRYEQFRTVLPDICLQAKLNPEELTFVDLSTITSEWLKANR